MKKEVKFSDCFFSPGGAGAISSLLHDGFMNPIDGECNAICLPPIVH